MSREPGAHHLYTVIIQGQTLTLEGPADIVSMYRTIRRTYPPAVSVEIGSVDDDPRLHDPGGVQAHKKVNSHYGDH